METLATTLPPLTPRRVFQVAVVGNPNAGKTTLFNGLTGLSQRVGNYPGVTVEKKSGRLGNTSPAIDLLDLPGTYSLAAHSPDEMVVVDVLLGHQSPEPPPDALLAVVDASNLERNLYLVSQLLDLDRPVVVALNMMDVARARGLRINTAHLEEALGVPVVEVEAHRRRGFDALRLALEAAATRPAQPPRRFPRPPALEATLSDLDRELRPLMSRGLQRPVHPIEIERALIDEQGSAEERAIRCTGGAAAAILGRARSALPGEIPLSALEARERYRWIRSLTRGCVQRDPVTSSSWTTRLDNVLTHPVLGLLVFAAVMLLLFQTLFRWSVPLMDAIDRSVGWCGQQVADVIPAGMLQSLVVEGMIGGVGAVVVFLPQILLLFLFLAILEDCGYMARAAFLIDRLMARCGLSGRSFIPMLSGFACAVPAIMAARVIENRRDRLATILVTPLMSCSARLPVYTIFAAGFLPATLIGGWLSLQALALFLLYAVGVATAALVALLLKRTLLRGPTPPFVLELPSYKWPAPINVGRRVLRAGSSFLTRAGSIILAMTIVVWALAFFPRSQAVARKFDQLRAEQPEQRTVLDQQEAAAYLESSVLGRMGRAIEPAFEPLGWDWRLSVATLASFPAREVIVATLGTIFQLGSDVDEDSQDLRSALRAAERADGSPLITLPVALSVMVFFALCCQCGATVATIRRETGSWGWAWLTFGYMTVLAYVAALLVYQVGSRIPC